MEKLNEKELNKVFGGAGTLENKTISTVDPENSLGSKEMYCEKCGEIRKFYLFSGGRCVCSKCFHEIFK